MFHTFARVAQEQNQIKQIKQVTSIIEILISNIRKISNNEVNIHTSLAMKNWFLNKTKEEKFLIADRFIKEFYKDIY